MKAINLLNWKPATIKNEGDAREWALCSYMGIERVKHDTTAYNKASDVDTGDRHISVKASKFSLMSGRLCEGKTEFDAIWNLYADNTHSNEWCYMTADYTAYMMNLEEFKRFVYAFCKVEKESEKNGGACKIRCKSESKAMLRWLEAQVA